MATATTQGTPDDDVPEFLPEVLGEMLRGIRERLQGIEEKIEPPVRPDGHPFRKPGQQVSASEYERRTGIPRAAAALALHLMQYNQSEIARRVGVNRRTLQVSEEFEPYRLARISVRQNSGLARQNDDDED